MKLKEYKGEIIVTQSLKDYFSSCKVSTTFLLGKNNKFKI